jgi:hypothetical protein
MRFAFCGCAAPVAAKGANRGHPVTQLRRFAFVEIAGGSAGASPSQKTSGFCVSAEIPCSPTLPTCSVGDLDKCVDFGEWADDLRHVCQAFLADMGQNGQNVVAGAQRGHVRRESVATRKIESSCQRAYGFICTVRGLVADFNIHTKKKSKVGVRLPRRLSLPWISTRRRS